MKHCSKKLCERFCFQSHMLYVNCHEILIHSERMISITFLVHGHWYYHRAATLVQYFFCEFSKSATSKRRNLKNRRKVTRIHFHCRQKPSSIYSTALFRLLLQLLNREPLRLLEPYPIQYHVHKPAYFHIWSF